MKTPDLIKKALEACGVLDGDCENCPYDDGPQLVCVDRLRKDALAYIQRLEEREQLLFAAIHAVMHSVDKWLDVEPYDFDKDDGTVAATRASDAREVALRAIEKLESTISQVSKALCGKENAALEEMLDEVNQLQCDRMAWGDVAPSPGAVEDMAMEINRLNERLAQVEREKDAAIADLSNSCTTCKFIGLDFDDSPCEDCFQQCGKFPWSPMVRTKFEWRGVCSENTKEETK